MENSENDVVDGWEDVVVVESVSVVFGGVVDEEILVNDVLEPKVNVDLVSPNFKDVADGSPNFKDVADGSPNLGTVVSPNFGSVEGVSPNFGRVFVASPKFGVVVVVDSPNFKVDGASPNMNGFGCSSIKIINIYRIFNGIIISKINILLGVSTDFFSLSVVVKGPKLLNGVVVVVVAGLSTVGVTNLFK